MKNTGTLQVTTPTDREIVLTRVFDAPRRMVFDAFSKAELLKQWFGPRGWSLVVCEVDLKVGGGFRLCCVAPAARRWGCAASIARSCRPSAPSTWSHLMTTQVSRR